MKRRYGILSSIFVLLCGCVLHDNADVIVINFVSKGVISANGRDFPLYSKEDGGQIIESFPKATKMRLKNIHNAMFSDIWKIVDCHNLHREMQAPLSFEILLPTGAAKEIKFFGRASDPLWMGRIDTQTAINVTSDCSLDEKKMKQGTETYLQIWCEISSTKGCDILETIEKYLSCAGESNDIYLLPY